MMAGPVLDSVRDVSGVAAGSLVAAVWKGALLAGAAGLGLRLFPKTPAAARFASWFSVFVMVAVLPLAGPFARPAGPSEAAVASHAAWFTLDARWSEVVLLLWIGMSLARAVMLGVAAVRVRALWTRATPMSVDVPVLLGSGQRTIFGREIQLCTSGEVDRPSVIGFFAPKILIPTSLVDTLTTEEMAQVVLHEAGHLRRADDWLNLLQKIALMVFPLNPALAWVERRLCFERELACDERVLNATGAPKAYASCLTALAEHRISRRGMALVMGALGRESELGQRVRRILSRSEQMRPLQARLVTAGAMVALIAGAVGLDQCPQLVGFTSASPPWSLAGQDTATGKTVRSAQYRDVVYRPGRGARAVDTVLRQPVVDGAALGKSERGKGVRAVSAAPAVVSKRGSAKELRAKQVSREGVATEWVVLTSWSGDMDGDGGARIVMTSLQTEPVARRFNHSLANSAHMQDEAVVDRGAGRVPVVQQMQQFEQISPYAAVPVRGGWLVIQL
jgi:beta-lactamase regulating signal transducer with metallopeptidase domain